MSESLPVELNGESVHAIEAPETFTTGGPFHVELRNEGGAVHIHIHLSDSLVRAARIEDGNHYVESEETVRVPVGTVPERSATGYLEIVTGYGTERERVEVTISSMPASDRATRGTPETDRGPDSSDRAGRSTTDPEHESDSSDYDAPGITPSSRGGHAGTAGPRSSDRQPMKRASETETSTQAGRAMETETPTPSAGGGTADGPWVRLLTDTPSEAVAFAVLAAVAVVVGVAVILVVANLVLSLVVAGVVTASVAAVGWLLFE